MKIARLLVLPALVLALVATPIQASGASRLPAPTITSAVASSATSITVSWTAVDRASSYELRWTAYGEASTLTTTATTAKATVFAATPYAVEVRALSRNASSVWSTPVFVTTPPAAPTSVVGTAVRPDLVELSWSTGYGEASYEVYSVNADGSYTGPLDTWSYNNDLTPVYVSTTAETTTSYVVRSVAYDGQRSAPSEAVTVTTPQRWDSGTILFVYGPFDEGKVTLNAAVQNSPEDRFNTIRGEMTFTIDGGQPKTIAVTGGSATLDVDLTAGTYSVTVAYSGDSAYQPSSSTTTIEVRPVLAALSAPEVLSANGAATYGAAVGDVTGDGRPDLVTVVSGSTANSLLLRTGRADGTLSAPVSRSIPYGAQDVALGDLDGDGDADAVVPTPDGVLVLAGSPTGLGTPSLRRTTATAIDVAVANVTGDALADVVVSTTAGLQVLPSTGRLATGKAQTIAAGTTVSDLEIGDVTGDARPDIAGIVSGAETTSVGVWTVGSSGWTRAFNEPAAGVGDVALGDVTGDARADLAWTAPAIYPEVPTQLRTGPAFTPLAVPYAPPVSGVGTGDLDGDGRDNLVAGPDSWPQAQVWRVTAAAVSPPAPVELGDSYRANTVLVTDISGDGRDDLLIVDSNAGLVVLRRI